MLLSLCNLTLCVARHSGQHGWDHSWSRYLPWIFRLFLVFSKIFSILFTSGDCAGQPLRLVCFHFYIFPQHELWNRSLPCMNRWTISDHKFFSRMSMYLAELLLPFIATNFQHHHSKYISKHNLSCTVWARTNSRRLFAKYKHVC